MVYEKPIWWRFFWVDISDSCFGYLILTKLHNHLLIIRFSLFFLIFWQTPMPVSKRVPSYTEQFSVCLFFLCPVFFRPLGYSIRSSSSSQSSGAQHMNSPYTTYPVALHNNQAHISKTMDIFLLPCYKWQIQWLISTFLLPLETVLRVWLLKNSSFFIYTLQTSTSQGSTNCTQGCKHARNVRAKRFSSAQNYMHINLSKHL